MLAGVDLFKDLIHAVRFAGFQVDEIAARTARIQSLVGMDTGHLVAAFVLESVHHIHHITDLQVAEMPAAQVVMRDQPDVSVA